MQRSRTIWGRRRLLEVCGATTAFALVGLPHQLADAEQLRAREAQAVPAGCNPSSDASGPGCGGITAGQACFSTDIRLPGLRYAVVARQPTVTCEVADFDATETFAVPGVEAVVQIGNPRGISLRFPLLGGVAVVAGNTWAALKGRDALKITWRRAGAIPPEIASPSVRSEVDCYVPDLSTTPMETPSATVRIEGACEVWAGFEAPELVRADVAALLGLRLHDVTMTATVLGGGFGRTSRPTYATEAATLSRHMGGAPIRLLWTRDDDIPLRQGSVAARGRPDPTLSHDGRAVAWLRSE